MQEETDRQGGGGGGGKGGGRRANRRGRWAEWRHWWSDRTSSVVETFLSQRAAALSENIQVWKKRDGPKNKWLVRAEGGSVGEKEEAFSAKQQEKQLELFPSQRKDQGSACSSEEEGPCQVSLHFLPTGCPAEQSWSWGSMFFWSSARGNRCRALSCDMVPTHIDEGRQDCSVADTSPARHSFSPLDAAVSPGIDPLPISSHLVAQSGSVSLACWCCGFFGEFNGSPTYTGARVCLFVLRETI